MSVKVLFIKYVTVSTCEFFARVQLVKNTQSGKGNVITEMFVRWNTLFFGKVRVVQKIWITIIMNVWACSTVGIATELQAGRSRIESRWWREFPPVQTIRGSHPTSCTMGTVSFPGVKCGQGVLLTTHPLLVSRSWKSRAIPLPTLWATPGL